MKKSIVILLFATIALSSGKLFAAGQDINYKVGDEAFTGYLYSPEAANGHSIILVHDWDGLTDYEKKRSEMLGELGYTVFSVDMYGADVRPTEISEKKKQTTALYKDRKRMRALLQGALSTARENGIDTTNAVAMGYCFGGAVTLELARSGENMKGFVSFHGGLTTPEGQGYSDTKGQVLILHGTADKAVSMDDFATLAEELEEAGVKHEMVTYAGAPHAFTVFGSERYREDADKKSWNRFVGYLSEVL